MRMIRIGSLLRIPLELATLLLILSHMLIPLAICRIARRNRAFLLLPRLTQLRAQGGDLEFQLATVIMVLCNRLSDFLVLVFPIIQVPIRAVSGLRQSADFRLENNELVLEIGNLSREGVVLGAVVFALTNKDFIAFREGVDFGADFGGSQLGGAQGVFEAADPSVAVGQFAALIGQVFFELVALDDDEAVLFARAID